MSVCAHLMTWYLEGFSWNLVWTLCHRWLLQNPNLKLSTVGNTNVTIAWSREVEWWLRHHPWSSAHAHHSPNPPQPNLSLPNLMQLKLHWWYPCACIKSWYYLLVFWWNLVWTLCHRWLLENPNLKLFHSVLPTWRLLQVVRWNDDYTITHDLLRMRITHLTHPNQTYPFLTLCSLSFISDIRVRAFNN
jgi:hypothetical protein